MENKSGIRTTEFWLTFVVNLAGSIIALLAARGLLTQEEGELWVALVQAIAVGVIPVALAIVNATYINSRKEIKAAAISNFYLSSGDAYTGDIHSDEDFVGGNQEHSIG